MSTERFNIIFKQYPLYVQLSAAMRGKAWKQTDDLPKYIQEGITKGLYKWSEKKKAYLDMETGNRLFKNKESAGKPRLKPISGQYFWTGGKAVEWYRTAIKEQLTAYFVPRITIQEWSKIYTKPGYYIQFEFIFYTPLRLVRKGKDEVSQDINNHSYAYIKVFQDVMQELQVITDDNHSVVRGDYYRYIEIQDPEERRLEVKIHFCRNEQGIND